MENSKGIKICLTDAWILILGENTETLVKIHIQTKVISEESILQRDKYSVLKSFTASAVLGLIRVEGNDFLVYVKDRSVKATIEQSSVYMVEEVGIIPFELGSQDFFLSSECEESLSNLKQLFRSGFFYSKEVELHKSAQIRAEAERDAFFQFDKYIWNFQMLQPFSEIKKPGDFFVKVIWGWVSQTSLFPVGQVNCQMMVISRRSSEHPGTRFNARGLTEEGKIANFIETEFSVELDGKSYSCVQFRGSIPVFFRQNNVQHMELTKKPGEGLKAYTSHVDEITKNFNYLFIVNLLSATKKLEIPLTQELETTIALSDNQKVKYSFWDFHSNCKDHNYDYTSRLIEEIKGILEIFSFYSKGESKQIGVVRTNCLDSLDRTNIAQARIAWEILSGLVEL